MAGFFRYILFCVFFAAGTGAVAFSLLVGEINDYYRNSDTLQKSEAENEQLKKLDAEYDLELRQLDHDPNIVARLKRMTIGEHPESEDTSFPTASSEDLEIAEFVLNDTGSANRPPDTFRMIVERCMEPTIRTSLFIAGTGLVFVNFIFFGRSKREPE